MSTNGVNNVEEADITECDGEKVVTMMDVLQEQQEFEEDANAVLGASDDKECTYSKGYIKRQAIYACLTCCSDAKDDPTQRAGVCLACSLTCHENHELIELYTKRNFRCDCGNPKFNSHPCQFTPNKTELNEDNNYNQNFSGIYCICNRPYPDPEATVEEEMIQCIICEDWLHSNHLEAVVPSNDLYAEMICKACMDKNDFLHDYTQLAVNYEVDVDVDTVNGVDNPENGVDTENTHLMNGKINTSDITDVNMENENGKTKVDGNSPTNEDNKVITEDDKKSNEQVSNMEITITKCTSESAEKLKLEEDNTTLMDNDDPQSTKNINLKPESTTKPDEPEMKYEKKEIDNETQPHLIASECPTSQINTPNVEQKVNDDDNKELTTPNLEQNEESITEQASEPTENSYEEENTNSLKDNNTTSNLNEKNEISDSGNSGPKDGDIKELAVSSAINEEKCDPSEPTDNALKETQENSDTKECPKQTKECEIDSLEAATKELSELMEDESEINHTSNDPKMNKSNDVQTEQTLESTANESSLKDEDLNNGTNKSTLENDSIPSSNENDYKRKLDCTSEEITVKKQKLDQNENCLRPRGVKRTLKGAAFWPSNFRQKLCTCNECLSMYKDLSVLFLTDPEDTVTAYETLGKEKTDGTPSTQYEKGLQALSSLDRVQQINALTEYNRMRDKLLDFLKSFKDRKEIVKEEDIKAFFAGMKPRREPDGVYFCR